MHTNLVWNIHSFLVCLKSRIEKCKSLYYSFIFFISKLPVIFLKLKKASDTIQENKGVSYIGFLWKLQIKKIKKLKITNYTSYIFINFF